MAQIKLHAGTERLIHSWLVLAIASLIFAGLFAFFIAMARTPYIQDVLPGIDNAKIYLAGHVVLSLVIWFLAFSGMLWVLASTGFGDREPGCSKTALAGFFMSAAGTAVLITPAILRKGTPVFTNYVPVIDHPLYYAGLLLFAAGMLVYLAGLLPGFISTFKGETKFRGESYGMAVAGVGVLVACLCYMLAYITFPGDLKKFVYLEHFFWGGGHVLQFVNSAGMLVAWMLLTRFTLDLSPLSDKKAAFVFGLLVLFMLPAPTFYFLFEGGQDSFKLAFTKLMQFGYIATVLVVAVGVIRAAMSTATGVSLGQRIKGLPWEKPGFSALAFSLLLFAAGGIFALFIRGSNTKIPSHYHGVIGAVTVSFMGLTYYILPLIRREIVTPRAAKFQPYIYGAGQLLFAIGLFWAGGHGVSRKTYGETQGLDSLVKKASMMTMGLGGLIAIIGGATFVYIVLRSLLAGRDKE